MNAWVVYWIDPSRPEYAGAAREDLPGEGKIPEEHWEQITVPAAAVVTILNSRKSSTEIAKWVEQLYADRLLSLESRIGFATSRKKYTWFSARSSLSGNVACGSSRPWLLGVLAYGLQLTRSQDGTEFLVFKSYEVDPKLFETSGR